MLCAEAATLGPGNIPWSRSLCFLLTMESLAGKVVLITGASSGIGAATAVEFARYGSRLVLTGCNVDNLNKTVEQCQAQGLDKDKILTVAANLGIDKDLTRIVYTTMSKFNTIHILINNAAIISSEDVQSLSVDLLDTTYRVNLRAVVLLTKLVIPHLKKNKGSVVNVSSVITKSPFASLMSYAIMKAALEIFTQDLALELAQYGVRVNTCCPGTIRTMCQTTGFGLQGEALKQFYKESGEMIPIGRVGYSEEIAQSIMFLASNASSFTTGANLVVDGGFSCTAAWTPRTILEQEKC